MSNEFIEHVLLPGHTIEAILKLKNNYSLSREQINDLVRRFNEINPDTRPPLAGSTVKIPILENLIGCP